MKVGTVKERKQSGLVYVCALYEAEILSLHKYYCRQQLPTEFNAEMQGVKHGNHPPAAHHHRPPTIIHLKVSATPSTTGINGNRWTTHTTNTLQHSSSIAPVDHQPGYSYTTHNIESRGSHICFHFIQSPNINNINIIIHQCLAVVWMVLRLTFRGRIKKKSLL